MIKNVLNLFFVLVVSYSLTVNGDVGDDDNETELFNTGGPCGQDHNLEGFKTIRRLVKEKNLEKLFDLVDGELQHGPRKKDIKNKKFDEVFSKEDVDAILTTPCFYKDLLIGMGNGQIWFFGREIIAINTDFKVNNHQDLPIGWVVDGAMLGTECFNDEWVSSDNYKAFTEKAGLGDWYNPGLSITDDSPLLKPIEAYGQTLYFASDIKLCSINSGEYKIMSDTYNDVGENKRKIYQEVVDEYRGYWYSYEVIKEVSTAKCQELAPNFTAKCKKSYLIYKDEQGGSSSYPTSYIYGLFELQNGSNVVVPLKRFENVNEGLNYLESQPYKEIYGKI